MLTTNENEMLLSENADMAVSFCASLSFLTYNNLSAMHAILKSLPVYTAGYFPGAIQLKYLLKGPTAASIWIHSDIRYTS